MKVLKHIAFEVETTLNDTNHIHIIIRKYQQIDRSANLYTYTSSSVVFYNLVVLTRFRHFLAVDI